jgi:hypothetical protein
MTTTTRVLGIDLASSWANLGSAMIAFDESGRGRDVIPAALRWPDVPFAPATLADAIDAYAREHGVSAVALDGPQGWRDPATDPALPGVGRRCDLAARTQGKVGVRPRTWPGNQRVWVEHCIDTFASLLARPGVVLADARGTPVPRGGYLVAECYPTSAWRTAGLTPLPSKAKRPSLREHYRALAARFELPSIDVDSHDDLQAIVAALTAAAAAGVGSLDPVSWGAPSRTLLDADGSLVRVEGLIWDARPRDSAAPLPAPSSPPRAHDTAPAARSATRPSEGAALYVTRKMLEHVNRDGGAAQRQIALRGFPPGTRAAPVRVPFTVDGEPFLLVVGDSHAAWWAHQDDEETRTSFELLFARLADTPAVLTRADLRVGA